MSIELKVPHVGESIHEVTIGEWLKREGQAVSRDEPLVALETDKASLEVSAPTSGTLSKLLKQAGESAQVGDVIALIQEGSDALPTGRPLGSGGAADDLPGIAEATVERKTLHDEDGPMILRVMPAARRLLDEHGLEPNQVPPSGPGGRLLKEDVLRHLETVRSAPVAAPPPAQAPLQPAPPSSDREELIRMTPMRRRIAQRLVQAQQEAALLTTFNEIDMSAVIELRKEYKATFEETHGVRLGFMSFFVKAAVEALKRQPELNAEVRGDMIAYKNYFNIGVAVGGKRGLVVPVIRDADRLSFAEIEQTIRDLATRAQKNKVRPDELQGGTFTISNGGVYGSLMSTPIINPPQSGILGMHAIQERPVARDGQVVIRPMMYVALTYDHRIVDGRESVTFLKRIKECVERPARILLET